MSVVPGLVLDILGEGRSFSDMLFLVMVNRLTAEERLGIAANWP